MVYLMSMGELTTTIEVAETSSDRRLHCNRCLHNTNHAVLYSTTVRWGEDVGYGASIDGADTYSLIQCRGCDNIRMVHEHWFSEACDEEGPIQNRDYHPPNVVRQKPDWLKWHIPLRARDLVELIDEIYRAVGVNAYRIAVMGVRALVERIMIEQVGDQGSFEKNIALFFDGGYVAGLQQQMFRETLIEAGHAAMHRSWAPSKEDLDTLLDIVEALIKGIYVDPARAVEVGKRIPPRNPQGGKGGI